jgi:O-antigen/teichoic acid export membrane protein
MKIRVSGTDRTVTVSDNTAEPLAALPADSEGPTVPHTSAEEDSRSSRRHPAVNAGLVGAQTLVLNALSVFATAYVIRRLGTRQYGEWATAAAMATTLALITNMGLRTLFVRDLAREPDRAESRLAEQLGVRMSLGLLASASAMVISWLVGYPVVVQYCLAVASVGILLSVVSSTLVDFLQSKERFGAFAAAGLISGLSVTLASIAAAFLNAGPIGLSVAYLTTPIVNVVICRRLVRQHVSIRFHWSFARARTLLRESRSVGIMAIATSARARLEQLLIPAMMDIEAAGVFSAGGLIADRLAILPDAIGTAFYPRVASARHRSDSLGTDAVVAMLTTCLAATLPIPILGMYFARLLGELLTPASMDACRLVVLITVFALPITAINTAMLYALQAAGLHDASARLGVIATMVSALPAIELIRLFGLAGASWSLATRPSLFALSLVPLVGRTFPGLLGRLPLGRILLSAAPLAVLCAASSGAHVAWSLTFAGTGLACYVLGLHGLRVLSLPSLLGSAASDKRT